MLNEEELHSRMLVNVLGSIKYEKVTLYLTNRTNQNHQGSHSSMLIEKLLKKL